MNRFVAPQLVQSGVFLLSTVASWLFFGTAHALAATTTSLVTLDTRPGVTQEFILIKPDQPVASVILFAGGNGVLNLSQDANGNPVIGGLSGNFLVRTRQGFVNRGFMVAVVDAPSDHQGASGMDGGFRASAEHAQDIAAVVAYLRSQVSVPVWLVGTSCGTDSATNVAIRLTQSIGGLGLTSSLTARTNSCGPNVVDMNLEAIQVPVFVMAHDQDQCLSSPPSGAQIIVSRLTGAPVTGLAMLTGGLPPISGPCDAFSQHGYYGIESQAVDAVAVFIKANSPYSISASPTASGPLTARILAVTVKPALAELGTTRQVFVAAVVGPRFYFLTPAGWQVWSSGSFPVYASGAFAAQTIQVLDGSLDLSGVVGAQIYVGYGVDDAEMLANGRYAMVHRVQ